MAQCLLYRTSTVEVHVWFTIGYAQNIKCLSTAVCLNGGLHCVIPWTYNMNWPGVPFGLWNIK